MNAITNPKSIDGTPPQWWERQKDVLRLLILDHGILRELWSNMHQVSEGVWRASQPSPRRIHRLKAKGIRTIISLRGTTPTAHLRLEKDACERCNIAFHTCTLSGFELSEADELLRLLEILRTAERPLMFHCKSGADRSGLVSALYLLSQDNFQPEAVKQQLNYRYFHFSMGRAGVLDLLVSTIITDLSESGDSLVKWLETRYDPIAVHREFALRQGMKKGLLSKIIPNLN